MSPRREYPIRYVCAEPGCTETYYSVASTREDERSTRAWYAKRPWRCTRHTAADEVLSTENLERVTVLTADRVESRSSRRRPEGEPDYLDGLFWSGSSGFQYGPGFKAFAKDFPPGTRLIVTARIELPDPESSPLRADLAPRSGAAHPGPVSRDGGTGSGCASNP